jgi:integrase
MPNIHITKTTPEKIHITKTAIEKIPHPSKGQVLYRDTTLRGFGVRVSATSKVFFVEGQVNRTTRRVSLGRADVFSPEVARKKALTILGEMADGHDPHKARQVELARKMTLAAAFDAFFLAKPNLAACTVEGYKRTLRRYLPDWKNTAVSEISRQMVLLRHRKISEKFGPITANNSFRHFRSVFNFTAASFDEFPQNPAVILTQARAWHREVRRRRLISIQDLPLWWATIMVENEDARDICVTGIFTGLRKSEILRLEWEHVDLVAKTLHLPTTKNGDELTLPIAEVMVAMLVGRREKAGQSPWVFPSGRTGNHIVEVKSFISRIVEASEIEFSMHDLRRTFVTIAESLDISSYVLKRLLNHRSDADVTSGYIILNAERLRGPADRIAARILELVNAETRQEKGEANSP